MEGIDALGDHRGRVFGVDAGHHIAQHALAVVEFHSVDNPLVKGLEHRCGVGWEEHDLGVAEGEAVWVGWGVVDEEEHMAILGTHPLVEDLQHCAVDVGGHPGLFVVVPGYREGLHVEVPEAVGFGSLANDDRSLELADSIDDEAGSEAVFGFLAPCAVLASDRQSAVRQGTEEEAGLVHVEDVSR